MILTSPITIKELLLSIKYNGRIIGNSQFQIKGLNDDFVVQPYDLTWTESISLQNKLVKGGRPLAIITNTLNSCTNDNVVLIFSPNPLETFDKCVEKLLHETNKRPIIGENTLIHPSVVLGNNVSIGNNCSISPNVVIGDNTVIGNGVTILSNATIGAMPFYAQRDENKVFVKRTIAGNVIIEDDVQIGVSSVIDRGITGSTFIGKGTKLGNFVEIAHDVYIGSYCGLCAQVAISGYVKIGDYCEFWGKSGVANRIIIAKNTTVLASSVVTKNILTEGRTLCGFPAVDRIDYWRNYRANNVSNT